MAFQANRPGAATHLDRAKQVTRELIARLSPGGESVALVSAGRPARVVLRPTYDLAAAAAAVDRVEQSQADTDLPGALESALAIGRENTREPMRRLELITDGSRSAWEPALLRDRLAAAGRQLPETFRVRHFNLSVPEQWNAAVVDVSPSAALVRIGFDNDVLATVRSFGRTAPATVTWSLDNRPLPGAATIEATPDTAPVRQSQAPFREGGPHVVETSFRTAGDRLPVDDVRRRTVDVAGGLRVLIVEGQRGVGAMASYLLPEWISDIELGNRVLDDYRAVILAGVGQVAASQADLLARFVEDGGTLILFMGESVSSDNYNQVLLPRGLLPGPLARRVAVGSDQRGFTFDFKPMGALHPLLRVFAGAENTGLDTAQVFTYWKVDLDDATKAERVLDYAAAAGSAGPADPAITLHRRGAGRVVFVSTTADAEWTSFPAKPAYVALMHELLAGSIVSGDAWLNRGIGQTLELPSSLRLTAAPRLLDPTGQEVALQQVATPDGRGSYRSPPLERAGVYRLDTGARVLPVSVNPPAGEEADIRPVAEAGVRAALGGIEIEQAGDTVPPAAVSADRGGRDYGWLVMAAVLALVVIESVMAMRFGHTRRS
jgi:hypothetical protein